MYEQNASYLVKHLELGAKNLNEICLRIVETVPKWPMQHVNFQKFFVVACPRTPLEPFLLSIFFKIVLPEKNTLENVANLGAPSLKKILEYIADMKTFLKGFHAFLGLMSLYLVNTQPNSKFHPPHQKFLDPLLSAGFEDIFRTPLRLKFAGCAPA